MSSAQIERDFSVASLVLPSNRGSMDARYFQAQLCALVNFLHLVHPEDMSLKSMSAKEVSEALPAHGFVVPDLYPEWVYDDSHDEGYDSGRICQLMSVPMHQAMWTLSTCQPLLTMRGMRHLSNRVCRQEKWGRN